MSEKIEQKYVWVVWSNTDLTEGRGNEYPMWVCGTEATAQRLRHSAYIQGTDAPVRKTKVHWENSEHKGFGYWVGPVRIEEPTVEDIDIQRRIDEERGRVEQKDALIERLRGLGASEEDIEAVRGLR